MEVRMQYLTSEKKERLGLLNNWKIIFLKCLVEIKYLYLGF